MAADLELSTDLKLERVLGISVVEHLSKSLKTQTAKAVEEGLLEGNEKGLARIKRKYERSTSAEDRRVLEKLYSRGLAAAERAERKKRSDEDRQARREQAMADKAAAAEARRQAAAEARDLRNIALVHEAMGVLNTPLTGYTDATEGYKAARRASTYLNVLLRPSMSRYVPAEIKAQAGELKPIADAAKNKYAKDIRFDLPWERLVREQAENDRIYAHGSWQTSLAASNAYRNVQVEAIADSYLSERDLKEIELYEAFAGKRVKSQKDIDAIKAGTFGVSDTESILKKIEKNTGITAGLLVATGTSILGNVLPSIWNERAQRSYTEHRLAVAQRETAVGESVGSILGMAIGGLFGTVATGGNAVGGLAGAEIGGNVGGLVGGLFGKYDEATIKAYAKSVAEATERVRNQGLFGVGYSTSYARMVGQQGLASSADVSSMAKNSLTLRGRMMLGQVGEQEMFYYSMLPNYFAALLAGVQGPELTNLYAQDLNAIADPSLRATIGMAVGGGSEGMYALSQSPFLGQIQQAEGYTRAVDQAADYWSRGVVASGTRRGTYALDKELKGFVDISRSGDPMFFHEDYITATDEEKRGINAQVDAMGKRRTGGISAQELLDALSRKTTTVIINVDGQEKDTIEFKEDYMNASQTMIVGAV